MENYEPIDPWKHRSQGMRCKTCMWFAPKIRGSIQCEPCPTELKNHAYPPYHAELVDCQSDPPVHIGRCRRHAPTMNGYPVVFVNDWCGDHKLNEEAL